MTDDSRWAPKYLLDLHNEVMSVGGGYWATFKVRRVDQSSAHPHGIKYSLTLHRKGGHRVLGYDNAHLPENLKRIRDIGGAETITLDHKHWRDRDAQHYIFISPEKLLEDFWSDVYRILKEEGIK
jgi:hypothetical protein